MNCDNCSKEFASKSGLNKHKRTCLAVEKQLQPTEQKQAIAQTEQKTQLPTDKKQPQQVEQNTQLTEQKQAIIQNTKLGQLSELKNMFKSCLDILRNDKSHLCGEEALEELSKFIVWKLIEPQIINNTIDVMDVKYYKYGKMSEENFRTELENVIFSKFAITCKMPLRVDLLRSCFDLFIIGQIFSQHPTLKNIFKTEKTKINDSQTIAKLVDMIQTANLEKYEHDILGEAYENIFIDAIFGGGKIQKSEMGQFFTPPPVKQLLLKLVDPKIKPNGEIESIMDPAAGTGGILNVVIRHYQKIAKELNIPAVILQTQLLKNVYGMEIKDKIFNMCAANMIINTGEILPNVKCNDSIRTFHNMKVDIIIANPPFSVSIAYDLNMLRDFGDEENFYNYLPIKLGAKSSELMFLQMMINSLNIGGRCATVMLAGAKMQGTNISYMKTREYLLRSCDLHEVILCPGGTFTSTGSKTCILFFTKKKNRADVVSVSGGLALNSVFKTKEFTTTSVKFYNFNPVNGDKNFICEIPIKQIIAKKYSLDPVDYEPEPEYKKENGFNWINLGDLCTINAGKFISRNMDNKDKIPFYSCISNNPAGTHSQYSFNYPEYVLLVGSGGSRENLAGINVGMGKSYYVTGKTACVCGVKALIAKDKRLCPKFLYYYLNITKHITNQKAHFTTSLGNISIERMETIKIPLVSINKQKKIVEFLDKLFDPKISNSDEISRSNSTTNTASTLSDESPRSDESIPVAFPENFNDYENICDEIKKQNEPSNESQTGEPSYELQIGEPSDQSSEEQKDDHSEESQERSSNDSIINNENDSSKKYDIRKVAEFYKDYDIFYLLIKEQYDLFETFVKSYAIIQYDENHITQIKEKIISMTKIKIAGSKTQTKKLGDICTIDYGTRILKKDNVDKNQFPVYGGGDIVFYTDKFNRNGFNILISRFGMSRNCLRLIDEKIFLNDSGLTVKPVNSTILHKFLGYYLHINQIEIYQCGRGAAQKNIDINKFKEIKIEIPSLEIQNEIVIYCDDQNRKIEELKKEIEQNKEMIKKHLTMVLEKCEKTEIQNDLIENTAGTITAENNTTATIENITIENTTIENITTATIENTTIESKNDKPDATKKPKRNSRKKTVPHNEGNCNEENNHREEDKIQDTKPQPRKRQPREKKEKKIIILDDFVDGDE